MKMSTLSSLFVLLSVVSLIAIAPSAFAAHHEVTITNALGSASNQDCAPDCFIPNPVTVDLGTIVTWSNTDTAAHTATSGYAADGPDGVFDSSLVMAGGSFSYTTNTVGSFDYFCMVHPWMNGSVVVGEKITDEEKEEHLEEHEEMVVILEDGMFTNSTGTYYANGTAVIPEFGAVAMIVLATAIIGTVVIVKRGSMIGQTI